MAKLPLSDFVRHRWIAPGLRGEKRTQACLDYFGIGSFQELSNKYDSQLHSVSFRTSSSFDATPESVISWLRQGEIQAQNQNLGNWNIGMFQRAVARARDLTLEPDPSVFIPELQSLFSECGVAIAIAPTPQGCPASGAVYFFEKDKAVILLSFRYLSDDHFWFTLFHECGHLILHNGRHLLLEGTGTIVESEEREANEFAEHVLVPAEYQPELRRLDSKNLRGILKLAKKLGIAKGIVVGQLQHKGIVDKKHLNKLKVRYRWK
jgi:Zn-dependent peptidase ImmA (M78 family)